MTPYITVKEAAEFSGMGRKLIRKLWDSDTITGYLTPGGHRRISIDSLRRYMDGADNKTLAFLSELGL